MKLMVPSIYSQRDPQWAGTLLGYNPASARDQAGHPYTIGWYGCLITALGMYVGKTPTEVNTLLKENGGFTQNSGNFIWAKSEALGLSQVYQSPFYSDPVTSQGISKMKALLDEGRPLVCHIDFDPKDADDDQHWLLVYGYDDLEVFYALDPWTGTAITLDVYGGAKRCVYEWRSYSKQLPKDTGVDELTQCRLMRDENHNDRMACWEELGFTGGFTLDIAVAEIRKLKEIEAKYKAKDEQLILARSEVSQLEEKLKKLQEEHTKFVTESTQTIQEQGMALTTLSREVEDLKKATSVPTFKGWRKRLYNWLIRA